MNHEALTGIADDCIRAAAEVCQYLHGEVICHKLPWPPDLFGGVLCPAYLQSYTREEIEEACDFLVRLGVLEHRRKARKQ